VIPPWVEAKVGEYVIDEVDLVLGLDNSKYFPTDQLNGIACNFLNATDSWWIKHLLWTEDYYKRQLEAGWTPEKARGGLLLDLKTEIVFTFNMREWLHFFSERYKHTAHPQMQELATLLLIDLRGRIPVIFAEVTYS
jgi:thymidylate synthase ThyX